MTFTKQTARVAAVKGNKSRWKNLTPAQLKKKKEGMRKLAVKRWGKK